MSGRGGRGGRRGKPGGQTHLPSNIESLGISTNDKTNLHAPPPLFPSYDKKPLHLSTSQNDEILLAKKQYLREAFKDTLFYLKKTHSSIHNIDRYIDKYHHGNNEESDKDSLRSLLTRVPLWNKRLPKELHPRTKRFLKYKESDLLQKRLKANNVPSKQIPILPLDTKQDNNTTNPLSLELFNALETQEGGGNVVIATEEEEEEEDVPLEEEYDEEMEEEQGDYQLTYFDPGDDGISDDEENAQNYY